MHRYVKLLLAGLSCASVLATAAFAENFNIPSGSLDAALDVYTAQSGVQLAVSNDAIKGIKTSGVKGDLSAADALLHLLQGTGLAAKRDTNGIIEISHRNAFVDDQPVHMAAATAPTASGAALETVTVTSSKIGGDVQNIPISITAMSQEQLTQTQTAGGPDLVKQVPNLTFTKTNFTGYSIQIRGIGTQAISVTTDPAVAVAFNDIPFIRNHFFEQEFYDVSQVEVLRGPQGTLYGRNATAGVVNLVSAKPSDQFEAMASADIGNYQNRRLEAMINVPVVDDRLDFRIAGEWTKRKGYTYDQEVNASIDGRDLWSGRLSIGFYPSENLHTNFVWEHFSEDDDRMRSAKQLCEKDPGPTSVGGVDLLTLQGPFGGLPGYLTAFARTWLSQGCLPTSFYSPSAYETPNGQTLPFVELGEFSDNRGGASDGFLLNLVDPYASQTQPMNLRVIQSLILPRYRAKNDTLEYNLSYAVTPQLTLLSATGYNNDFLFSTEDFNRFDTTPGIFSEGLSGGPNDAVLPNGVYCDPQLGCSSSMVAADLSDEHASQFNQELRLSSDFHGPLNFSVGTNYTHYQTIEDYYVFFNLLTAEAQRYNNSGPGQYDICNPGIPFIIPPTPFTDPVGVAGHGGGTPADVSSMFACSANFTNHGYAGTYIDPNPIGSLDGQGHNYFRSENPYALNSWAGFGEVYYNVTPDLKLTGGLRWTDDRKVFWNIPSAAFELGGGYPVASIVKQGWNEWTGRANVTWSPKINFTDQSMFYASYAHGYKAGGANPPGPVADYFSVESYSTHPPTFAPEHIEAFELGTKNTALDGSLTFNGDVFFYNYHGYQISQIVDRTSINLNFNATVKGAEVESTWEPLPGLRFNLAGGWEDSAVDKNQSEIDLMDRTAGNPDWTLVRSWISETSNCILPTAVVAQIFATDAVGGDFGGGISHACDIAYRAGQGFYFRPDTLVLAAFADNGFNPATAPGGGQGIAKNISGNKLPNTPPFTLSTGAQYSMPVTEDWAATLRGDFYWQGNSFARILNDKPYDQLRGYTNVNLTLILTNQDGWQVMGYLKNVFDTTAITGAFLNSDDTALTTNVFVTDPRLFGVRVTKNW
jgi:outer membrane receptor protein involved in Fe transport